MGLRRATVLPLMRAAIKRGQSVTSFYWDMRVKGLAYRKTDFLADYKGKKEIVSKEGKMQYVRRGYYPSEAAMAQVTWKIGHEYMYVVRIKPRPGMPIVEPEPKVNIMSDVPMTPAMVIQAVTEKWSEWEDYTAEELGEIIPWSAVHKVME